MLALLFFGLEYVLSRLYSRIGSNNSVSKKDIKNMEERADCGLPQSEEDIYPTLKGVNRQMYMQRVGPIVNSIVAMKRAQRCDSLVLDSGCGQGLITKRIALLGYETVGLDLSRSHLQGMSHWCKGLNTHVVLGDAECLPFKSSIFEVIVLTEVLEHVPNPQFLLSEHSRCLRKRGSLLLTTVNASRLPRTLNPFVWLERMISIYYPKALPKSPKVAMHRGTGELFIHASFSIRELTDLARAYELSLAKKLTTSFSLRPIYKLVAFFSSKLVTRAIGLTESFLSKLPVIRYMGNHIFVLLTKNRSHLQVRNGIINLKVETK